MPRSACPGWHSGISTPQGRTPEAKSARRTTPKLTSSPWCLQLRGADRRFSFLATTMIHQMGHASATTSMSVILRMHMCAASSTFSMVAKACALNLANSRGYSVKEVIATAENVCGSTIRSKMVARRQGDPPILVGDARKARALLGWEPGRSALEIQVRDAWNWLKQCGTANSATTSAPKESHRIET